MNDVLAILAVANLAAAAAVVLVLAIRRPARRWFGPGVAYGLWALAPLAALAMLLPGRTVTVVVEAAGVAATAPVEATLSAQPGTPPALDLLSLAAGLWIAGAIASLAWLAWKQLEFGRAARAGLAGPAVIGVLRPRIVTPSDFARRYTAREQAVVLAHEAAHIARHDSRINAVVALARCLNWFNPLVHVLAHYLRIDQELACDAAVVAAHPQARRSYAEAMLKTQLASRPLPLGCYWPASGVHPLAERVSLLARPEPSTARRRLGLAAVVLLGAVAAGSTWAARPARVDYVERAARPVERAVLGAAPAPRHVSEPMVRAAAPSVTTPSAEFVAPPPYTPEAAALDAAGDARAAAPLTHEPDTRRHAEPRPARKVFAAAERSRIEPGSAVRLVATMTDPEGRPLMTDLTAFGSQHFYRVGRFTRDGSRLVLFTSVVQQGDTLWVTASTNSDFRAPGVGTIAMKAGETRDMVLGDGQVVTVTPTLRPETAEEQAGSDPALRRAGADIDRDSRDRWRAFRDLCRACRAG